MARIRFTLVIPPERFESWYRGRAREVITRSRDGRTLRFPARVLQPFVTHEGIRGTFEIEFDHRNRFVGIRRIKEE